MRIDDIPPDISSHKLRTRTRAPAEEIKIELTRKSLHILIGFSAALLELSPYIAIGALTIGMIIYTISEILRHRGISVPLISALTAQAARRRDGNRFVIGPLTLAIGAIFAIILFDPLPAKIAILALAFGDSFSSLIGKTYGRIPMPFSGGKSLEGTVFCLIAVFLSTYLLTKRAVESLIIAACTAAVEFWPTKDWDNVIIPLAAGIAASIFF